MTCILLMIPAAISYYSSSRLYYGFKATKAKTFDECMERILGNKIGYISNIMIFLHTFGAVVVVWIFSYKSILSALKDIFGKTKVAGFETVFKYSYFTFVMLLLFASSLSGKIEKLKVISIFGLVIIIYLICVFSVLCTDYYEYYNEIEHIKIVNFEWNKYFFSTYGICQYLFLNQYTVIPICNNVKMVTSKRITKVIRRTILGSLVIYFLVLFIGYFSQPNLHIMDEADMEKLFILREKIPDSNDMPILIGKLLFGIYLIIAVLVKGHFFILYFNQLVMNTKNLIQGKPIIRAELGKMIYDHEQTSYPGENRIETLSMDNDLITEILNDQNNISADEIVIVKNTKRNKIITNFLFLLITTVLNLLLLDYLSKFLSIIGSFVSIFEIIVFPLAMLFALNAKIKLIGKAEKIVLIIFSFIFVIMGACAFVMSFFNDVRGALRRHGGDAQARLRDGGGLEVTLRLPTSDG